MNECKDFDQRFEELEKRIDTLFVSNTLIGSRILSGGSDEIELREFFRVLWRKKWLIIGIVILFAVAGVVYSLSLPNIYKSEGVYAPAQKEAGDGRMAGQLGGLASLAGVNLSSGISSDIDQAIALITSWPFLEYVVVKHDLKPIIMGVEGWDRETNEPIWDDEIYDPLAKQWQSQPREGKTAEPSGFEVFKELSKKLTVSKDPKTGLVNISFESYSPEFSSIVLDLIVSELNSHFQARDIKEANERIKYLESKISGTSLSEMQAVFYRMIEAQIKALMLAEVSEEYVLKTVVERKVPEEKNSPRRSLIVIFVAMVGGVLAVILVFVRYLSR